MCRIQKKTTEAIYSEQKKKNVYMYYKKKLTNSLISQDFVQDDFLENPVAVVKESKLFEFLTLDGYFLYTKSIEKFL